MTSQKVPLLLFSGGADSTARLVELLNHTPVDILYVEGHQHPLKLKMELRAQRRILKALQGKLPHNVRNVYKFPKIGIPDRSMASFCFRQAPDWFVAALYTLNVNAHSRVEMCYVLGDDALLILEKLQRAWENLVGAVIDGEYVDTLLHDCKVPLEFPYRATSKVQVYRYLTQELRDQIWVCETPIDRGRSLPQPCGTCKPCSTRRYALENI